jgi:hypothetical protein
MAKSKVHESAVLIGKYEGLSIYATPKPAKTRRGRNRIWIQIRQHDETKQWNIRESMMYVHGADVQFIRKDAKEGMRHVEQTSIEHTHDLSRLDA